MKNDHTYEYRVFTNRLVDVGPMEVGNCTRKVIDNLKSKDKVDGRFFHTSDSNEWFFCWDGKLQKLNLAGNASVNDALDAVKELIDKADAAVKQAQESVDKANNAADAAISAVNGKADLDYVNDEIEKVNSTATEAKATAEEVKSNVDRLSALVEELPSSKDIVTTSVLNDYAKTSDLGDYAKSSDLDGVIKSTDLESYATKEFVGEEIKKKNVSDFANDAGYLTKDVADSYYVALGTTGSGVDKNYVDTELDKKQDKIDDIEDIRSKAYSAITSEDLESKGYLTAQDISGKQDKIDDLKEIREGAAAGATALQTIPEEYVTETELKTKGYLTQQDITGKQDKIVDLEAIRSGAAAGATALQSIPEKYLTEESTVITDINSQIANINLLLGNADDFADKILNEIL